MSTLAICPSRGRPDAAHETLRSFNETIRDPGSRLVFIVDTDDPTRRQYPHGHVQAVRPGGSMGAALRLASHDRALLGNATSVGMIGDDNRFRTVGWDTVLDGWLTANVGIAYADDGFQHERLPTSWWLSRPLVDAFGMAEPTLSHFYMDNWALELGKAANCLRYFPDISIEHLHPLAGKAEDDAIYGRSRRFVAGDRQAFARWQRMGLRRDARRAREIIGSVEPRRVLADWHHPALWESLSILFEDRFGWELYAMAGEDWTRHGWALHNGTPGWTATDYLCPGGAVDSGGHLEVRGAEYPDRPRKMVTWGQAATMRWDFVLASVSEHQRPFFDLARRFRARLIHQVGNARHPIDRRIPQVVLASAVVPRLANVVRYHQEFDRELFGYAAPADPHRVTSFMLRLESTSCEYEWFAEAPGVAWSAVGGAAPGQPGYLAPMARVAEELRSSGWVWHDKRIGDGYGHVLHNAASVGRPLIGHASHYQGLLGAPLWRDLETCIDLDRHDRVEALRLFRAISADQDWYRDLTERTAAGFTRLVDFDAEAEQIRAALA